LNLEIRGVGKEDMAKHEGGGGKRGKAKKEKEEEDAEAAYVMQPVHHQRWVSGLRKFERFRMSHGYSVKDLFNTLNTRGTQRMTKNQFVETITEFLPSVRDYEALALARQIARQKRCNGFVTAHGIAVVLDSVEDLSSVRALLIDHPIFPSWLTERSDFQSLFEEWNSDNGCPSIYMIERTCASAAEKRRPADLAVLIKWLKIYNVLQQVTILFRVIVPHPSPITQQPSPGPFDTPPPLPSSLSPCRCAQAAY
jgi:hypothetical protein